MEVGDYKHYTRLELLAAVFGMENLRKVDLDESQWNATFYSWKRYRKKSKFMSKKTLEVTPEYYLAMNPSDLEWA